MPLFKIVPHVPYGTRNCCMTPAKDVGAELIRSRTFSIINIKTWFTVEK